MITLWAFHTCSAFGFSAAARALLGCREPLHISTGLLNQSAGRVYGEAKPRVSMLMTLPHSNIAERQLLQLYLQDSEGQHQQSPHESAGGSQPLQTQAQGVGGK